ncbi:MAG: radical SAM protein [Candidatus Gracilibacteria bacterium]|jgi:putative pyruvate formate lyase activating enzyme
MVKIAYIGKHFGEEPPLIGMGGAGGAGGIFFTGCNLKCVFCQNYQISQEGMGKDYSTEELAEEMLRLQADGAANIDLVTPTIWYKQIKKAIDLARGGGADGQGVLKIPIVWNSNGYEKVEILKEMEGYVDIYLPDFKYGLAEVGLKYSGVPEYPRVAKEAIKEMLRQLGNLQVGADSVGSDADGLATRGVLVRHMVLPGHTQNSKEALRILAEIADESGVPREEFYVSLMNQYYPLHKAADFPEINRTVTAEEFDDVFDELVRLGFENGFVQDEESRTILIPDFRKEEPFG